MLIYISTFTVVSARDKIFSLNESRLDYIYSTRSTMQIVKYYIRFD